MDHLSITLAEIMRQNTIKDERKVPTVKLSSNMNLSFQNRRQISSPNKSKFATVTNIHTVVNTKFDKNLLKKVDNFIMCMDKDNGNKTKSPLKPIPRRVETTKNTSETLNNTIRSDKRIVKEQNVQSFWINNCL